MALEGDMYGTLIWLCNSGRQESQLITLEEDKLAVNMDNVIAGKITIEEESTGYFIWEEGRTRRKDLQVYNTGR